MGRRSDETDRAAPPAPVSGAPSGRGVVVVVTDEVRRVTGVPPDVPALRVVDVVDTAVVEVADTAVVEVVDTAVVEVADTAVVEVVDTGVVEVVDTAVVEVADTAVVVVDDARRQVGTVIVLSSIVTAPPSARTRPFTVAPVFSVIDVEARIDPAKLVVVPSVAELPTCQNTLHA
jgi:hypothetical protein